MVDFMTDQTRSGMNLRFSLVFKQLGLTQKEFGGRLGLSQNQVSTILAGKSAITPATVQLLRHEFRINPDYLHTGASPLFLPPDIPFIPILTEIPSGPWRRWMDSRATETGTDYLAAPHDIPGENLFAVRVTEHSMEPVISPGDIVIINPHREFTRGIAVVCRREGYRIRLARPIDSGYLLIPFHPDYDEERLTTDDDTRFYVPVKVLSIRDI